VVQLWETSHATRVVGEVKPGDTGVATDKAWSALQGCMFYYVVIGDQEGWVCDKYLKFKQTSNTTHLVAPKPAPGLAQRCASPLVVSLPTSPKIVI